MTSTPLRPIQRRPKERRRTVHIVIHRLWRQDSRRRSVVYRRGRRGPGLVTVVWRSVGSRLCGHPRFVVCRRFVIESALAEANSFLVGCQPFCNILGGSFFARRRHGTDVAVVKLCARIGRGLTQVNLVSTLEQSPARGDTAATQEFLETAPVSETDELTNGNRVPTVSIHRRGLRMPDATRSEQPWPRASGPSSPTIVVGRGCTGSGCGCAPGPAGRSCRIGAARVAASSLRDSTRDLARCFRLDTG
jgi:hypothetical protein